MARVFLAIARLYKRFAGLPSADLLIWLASARQVKGFAGLPLAGSLLTAIARLVKRFAGLPPAPPPFSSQRNVGQRCARGGSVVR